MKPADDGGDAPITYTITLQGGQNTTKRTVSSLNTTFTGLEAPNTYTVTVTAVNSAGNSSPLEGGIHFQGKLELAYIPTSSPLCIMHSAISTYDILVTCPEIV